MDHLRDKLTAAGRLISTVLERYRRPAVLWSGGKDSMVLLYILRSRRLKLPVIWFRQPWPAGKKHRWIESMIAQWGLEVYSPPPLTVTVQQKGERVELVNYYQLGSAGGTAQTIAVPHNLEHGELCGLDWFNQPKGTFNAPWDCYFHGHKSTDTDPMLGPVPIDTELLQRPGGPDFCFPLKDWTDHDIWNYSRSANVPQDSARYDVNRGTELADRQANPDWWGVCTRCMDRRTDGQLVDCPKYSVKLNNISKQLGVHKPLRPDYISCPSTLQ